MSLHFFQFSVKYALRSLLRNRRRSILLIATVVLSVAVSIVAKAYADQIFSFWISSATESGVGEAQIHKQGYWNESTSLTRNHCFFAGEAVESLLSNDKDIAGFAPRLEVEGLVSFKNRSVYFSGMGLQAEAERIVSPQLFTFSGNEGVFVSADDASGVAIGRGLAESLGVSIGDTLTITVQTMENNLNARDVLVKGIVNFPDTKLSKRLIYLNLSFVQDLLLLEGGYSEIAIRLHDALSLQKWSDRRKPEFSALGAELRPWWDVFPPMQKVESIWQSVVGAICFLLFLSTSLSVLNVIFLAVGERTIEIGVLMALGIKACRVKYLFAMEAILVGIAGALVGILLGNFAIVTMRTIGVPLPNPFFPGYIFIYPNVQPGISILLGLAAVLICYLSSLFPSAKAARVEPVTAFRGQV